MKIQGTLVVIRRNGANGSFSVGNLRTQIGDFKIKDSFLDQYEEGEYHGEFILSRIFISPYSWRGSVTVELRAVIEEVFITDAEEGAVLSDAPMPVGDPLTESSNISTVPVESEIFDEELMSLINAGSPVKLDSTVDRTLFRAQRDALSKEFGYEFKYKNQTWYKV